MPPLALVAAIALLASILLSVLPLRAEAPDGPVALPSGSYEIRLPEGDGPFPAVMHLHGYGGSAASVMTSNGFASGILDRGYALIAPEGFARPGQRRRNWAVRDGSTYARDDAAFLDAVLDDAAARGWIDRDRVLMTGFSRGGSMVWDVACHHPGTAAAYAPVSGAFWEPLPERCEGPVNLFHTHGWADGVVPFEGRSVAGGRLTQGDLFVSLQILRAAGGVPRANSDALPVTRRVSAAGDIWWRTWRSPSGAQIDLMLHPGHHGVPRGWTERALDWFEERLAARAGTCTAAAADEAGLTC